MYSINDLHVRYGPVVRVAPNEISFIESEAWTSIYAQSRGYRFKKDPNFYGSGIKKAQSLVTQYDKRSHVRVRSTFNKSFTETAIKDQENLLLKQSEAMLRYIEIQRESSNGIVNLVNVYMFTQLQTIVELLFGLSADLLLSSDNELTGIKIPMFSALRISSRIGSLKRILPRSIAKLVVLVSTPSAILSAQKHVRNTAYFINRRLTEKRDHQGKDIWSTLLEGSGECRLSHDEMLANGSAFLIAGSETTTTVLSAVSYFLTKHPEIYNQLKTEVRGSFIRNEDVNLTAIQNLEYLNACINEGMRLFPPSPLGLPRVVPPEGTTICQYNIPAGVSCTKAFESHDFR